MVWSPDVDLVYGGRFARVEWTPHFLEVLMPFLPYELGGKEAWTTFRKALERDDVPSLVSLKCCLTHERT